MCVFTCWASSSLCWTLSTIWLAASTVGHNKTKVRKYYFHTWVRLNSQGCLETQDLSNSKFTVNYSMDGINSDTVSVCTTVITTEYWLWCLLQCYFLLWVVMATARGDIIQTSFCCYTSTRFSYLDFQMIHELWNKISAKNKQKRFHVWLRVE